MPVPIQCACGTRLAAPDDFAGLDVVCPQCRAILRVPLVFVRPQKPMLLNSSAMASHGPPPIGKSSRSRAMTRCLGITSVFLGCLALAICLIPGWGVVGRLLGALGLFFGVAGGVIVLAQKSRQGKMPVVGIGVCALSLTLGSVSQGPTKAVSTTVDAVSQEQDKIRQVAVQQGDEQKD
jgi:hypothetical protein